MSLLPVGGILGRYCVLWNLCLNNLFIFGIGKGGRIEGLFKPEASLVF